MFHFKTSAIFSLFSAVKYTHKQPATYDYSSTPRPCHNFAFMLEGEGEIQTAAEKFSVKRGDILFIPKGTTYVSRWSASPITAFHSIHFNFLPTADPFLNANIPVQILKTDDFDALYSLVEKIDENQYAQNQNSFFTPSAFFEICGKILPAVRFEQKETLHPIQPAIEFLQRNHIEKCTVAELANLCFLSPSRFFYLFKQLTGESPISFKNRLTIQAASQTLLLDKSVSIEEISERFGFESSVYFRRLFKKLTGKTPSQYKSEGHLI